MGIALLSENYLSANDFLLCNTSNRSPERKEGSVYDWI
jgi:hypothetical protein